MSCCVTVNVFICCSRVGSPSSMSRWQRVSIIIILRSVLLLLPLLQSVLTVQHQGLNIQILCGRWYAFHRTFIWQRMTDKSKMEHRDYYVGLQSHIIPQSPLLAEVKWGGLFFVAWVVWRSMKKVIRHQADSFRMWWWYDSGGGAAAAGTGWDGGTTCRGHVELLLLFLLLLPFLLLFLHLEVALVLLMTQLKIMTFKLASLSPRRNVVLVYTPLVTIYHILLLTDLTVSSGTRTTNEEQSWLAHLSRCEIFFLLMLPEYTPWVFCGRPLGRPK